MRIITWETKVASQRQNKKLIVFSIISFITFCLLESTIKESQVASHQHFLKSFPELRSSMKGIGT